MSLPNVSEGDPHVAAHNAERTALNQHVADTSNPHGVTKAQLGLDLVDNVSSTSKQDKSSLDADVATLAGTSASAIRTKLTSDFVARALPSYAGTRTRVFDPGFNIYGSAASRAAVRRARGFLLGSALTSLVPVTLIGDSSISGWKASAIGTDDYATQLTNLLKEAGYPVTGGWVFPANGQTPGDVRWTFGGTNTWQGRTVTTNNYAWSTQAGNVATFASTAIGTIMEMAFVTTAAGQSVTYSLDGGAQTGTFNLTANQVSKLSFTGLTSGTHTLQITTASTASNTIWLCGARVRNATGLSITNAGIYGSHTDDWIPTLISSSIINPFNLTTSIGGQPKLAFVTLGANDMLHAGHTLATAKANLSTIVNSLKTAGTTVIQRVYPYPSTAGLATAPGTSPIGSGTTWDQFLSAIYDVSDTYDTTLIDHSSLLGDSNTLETAGLLYSDHLHFLSPGQSAIAHADRRAFEAV